MKGAKKGAFNHSSTGYSRTGKQQQQSKKAVKPEKEEEPKTAEEIVGQDDNLNSGFGDYLRTPEAVEMMKLFVFANSIMLIVTMAWPNIREQYYWVRQWLASFQPEQDQ